MFVYRNYRGPPKLWITLSLVRAELPTKMTIPWPGTSIPPSLTYIELTDNFILVHLDRVNNLLPQYLKTFFQYEFLFALKYLSLFFASKHLETCESLSNLTEESQWIKNNVFYQVTRVCLLSFVSVKKTKKENQKITNNFSIETN